MGILRTKTIEPATGSTLTLGASGDTITVSSDSIKANTFKDAGGNTLFTSDGSGTLSSINSALVPGGPILISTATASDVASIEITSGIDSTYDEYVFYFFDINPSTDNSHLKFDCSVSSTFGTTNKTTTWFHNLHDEGDTSTDLSYGSGQTLAESTGTQYLTVNQGSGADESAAGILHLFSPSSTTFVKHFYARMQYLNNLDMSLDAFIAGYLNTTSAIDGIKFEMNQDTFDGVIQMYGIK